MAKSAICSIRVKLNKKKESLGCEMIMNSTNASLSSRDTTSNVDRNEPDGASFCPLISVFYRQCMYL